MYIRKERQKKVTSGITRENIERIHLVKKKEKKTRYEKVQYKNEEMRE